MRVLINAYAVCPGRGSEEGMGWNWCFNLAKHCELYIITESEFREQIQEALEKDAVLKERMHFHFIDAGETEEESAQIRRMCWNQGTWAFYLHYAKWQKKALGKAKEIIEAQEAKGEPIQIMHQQNMAGFREPGMLYKINEERIRAGKKRIPLVWGPMTGYGSIPIPFMLPGGLKFTAFYLVKNLLNDLQLRFHPRVRRMAKASDALFAATPEMQEGLSRAQHVHVEHIPETATVIKPGEAEIQRNLSPDAFRILWVGRFMYTKQLPLALRVLTKLRDIPGLEFHIVGKGFTDEETTKMHQLAKDLGVDDLCRWHGQIPNAEVHQLMQQCNIFFFTSIFEATSTVVLEAITNHLPIVCFNRSGFGPIVDSRIGRKINCKSPKQAIAEFSREIHDLYAHPEVCETMSRNCAEFARDLSWEKKALRIVKLYEFAMNKYV